MLEKLPTIAPKAEELEQLGFELPPPVPTDELFSNLNYGRIVNGKCVGTHYRFNMSHRLSIIINYDEQGRRHGPRIDYGATLSRYSEYDKDQLTLERKYGWSRAVMCELNLRDGVPHGPYYNCWEEGQFKNGERSGTWNFYDANTRDLLERTRYRLGKPHGYITYYWPFSGHKRCRLSVHKGVPHGWALYWSPEGRLLGRRRFKRGKLVHCTCSDFPPASPLLNVRLKRETYMRDRGATTLSLPDLDAVYALVSSQHAMGLEEQIDRETYYANPHPTHYSTNDSADSPVSVSVG